MDTRAVFQRISQKLRYDFEISSEINHAGSRGSAREGYLKEFLQSGRLPRKYAIGSGEIVGRTSNTSKQSDLIIYDNLNGISLVYDESTQVYPIDCIYGIIEVKSSLSKAELIDSLEKIKSFKSMSPRGNISRHQSKPFGMIFAYALAKNSLDSINENIIEWERNNSSDHWPNYVCVIDIGTIYHYKKMNVCTSSDQITSECIPIAIKYAGDSLFQFYKTLHDACASMTLGPVELQRYYDPATQLGEHEVGSTNVVNRYFPDGSHKNYSLSTTTINLIVNWCKEHGGLTFRDLLEKQYGFVNSVYEEAQLNAQVFLYNPRNLPGLHIAGPAHAASGSSNPIPPNLVSSVLTLTIDDELYFIDISGFSIKDMDEIL